MDFFLTLLLLVLGLLALACAFISVNALGRENNREKEHKKRLTELCRTLAWSLNSTADIVRLSGLRFPNKQEFIELSRRIKEKYCELNLDSATEKEAQEISGIIHEARLLLEDTLRPILVNDHH